MLIEYTRKYVEAFSSKDIEAVSALLGNEFVLEDPVVKRVEGKKKVLECIQGIFDSCKELDFSAKNIYQAGNTTIIEFILKFDDTTLNGVDIIEWEQEKMIELRAYLDVPK